MSTYRKPFSRAGYGNTPSSTAGAGKQRGLKRKLPEVLYEKVDTGKIELETVKPWIGTRITELLGVEDDVLIGMIGVLLEETRVHKSCEHIYTQLASFLEADAETFCVELWELLTSAQANAAKGGPGIPQKFLDDKRRQMERADAAYERMRDNQRRRDDASARRKPYHDERKNRDADGFRDRRTRFEKSAATAARSPATLEMGKRGGGERLGTVVESVCKKSVMDQQKLK
jgi:serine/arginine repetitive matrix protein 1